MVEQRSNRQSDSTPDTPDASGPSEAGSATEVGRQLHELALRYWAEGKTQDALRVETQAADVLGLEDPQSELVGEIRATAEAIARDIREAG